MITFNIFNLWNIFLQTSTNANNLHQSVILWQHVAIIEVHFHVSARKVTLEMGRWTAQVLSNFLRRISFYKASRKCIQKCELVHIITFNIDSCDVLTLEYPSQTSTNAKNLHQSVIPWPHVAIFVVHFRVSARKVTLEMGRWTVLVWYISSVKSIWPQTRRHFLKSKNIFKASYDEPNSFKSFTFPTDIDECQQSPSVCNPLATCSNINGALKCQCRKGYTGDGKTNCTGKICLNNEYASWNVLKCPNPNRPISLACS